MGTDSRIGKRFLFAGIGYGGSCFPKDVQALEKSAVDAAYDFRILKAVMAVNEAQKVALLPRVKKHFGNLKGKTIALWGLSFKPHTDDIREAPALYNIDEFLKEGARIKAHDPEAMANVKKIYGDKVEFCEGPYQALDGADALFIATEWPEYRTPDFEKLSKALPSKVIFDGRNLYDLSAMKELGFTYYSIGRETIYG
jgi:UDPglucose 6-dehydrogenase